MGYRPETVCRLIHNRILITSEILLRETANVSDDDDDDDDDDDITY